MMKAYLALAFLLIGYTNAHYVFGRLIVNNEWTKTFEYVRPVAPIGGTDMEIVHPSKDPTSLDLRCGRNATGTGALTKTIDIHAGDTVGFGLGEPTYTYGGDDYKWKIFHPGPGFVWLSKAPNDNLDSYTGDGDWFKILEVIGRTPQSQPLGNKSLDYFTQWGMYWTQSWNFTIPKTTPPGKYLLRIEHMFPGDITNESQYTQWYMNCAQVNILNKGPNIGTPGPLVKIPGVYTFGQPDVYFDPFNYPGRENFDFSKYKPPAPAPWQG